MCWLGVMVDGRVDRICEVSSRTYCCKEATAEEWTDVM